MTWPKWGWAAVVIALQCVAASVFATTYTWTGKAPSPNNQKWTDPQNWSPTNNAPTTGDTAIISGGPVSVDQPVTVAILQITNSILQGPSSLTINNSLKSQASTLQPAGGITMNGNMMIDPLNPSTRLTALGCNMVVSGTAQVNTNGIFQLGTGVSVVNNGTFTLGDGGQLNHLSANSVFINQNQFRASNSICNGIGLFTNAPGGVVDVPAGTFQFQPGQIANNGSFLAEGSAVIRMTVSVAIHNGAVFSGTGTNILLNNNTLDGLATVLGNLQIGDPFTTAGLTITGRLEVVSSGNLIWIGGGIQGVGTNVTGTVLIDDESRMTINELGTTSLKNIVLTNNGNLNWTSVSAVFMGYNARIDNVGTLFIEADGTLSPLTSGTPGFDTATFNNTGNEVHQGFVIKEQGATNSDTAITVPFFGGFVKVNQGNLLFSGGGSVSRLSAGTNTTIQFTSGSYFVDGNPGTIGEAGKGGAVKLKTTATLKIDTQLNNFDLLSLEGGTIKGNGGLSVQPGGNLNWLSGTISLTNSTPQSGVEIDTGGTLNISGGTGVKTLGAGRVQNFGQVNWTNDTSGLNFGNGTSFLNKKYMDIGCDTFFSDISTTVHPAFTNYGQSYITKGSFTGTTTIGFKIVNAGGIILKNGTMEVAQYGDNIEDIFDSGVLGMNGGTFKFDNSAALHGRVEGHGKLIVNGALTNSGNFATDDGDTIQMQGNLVNDGPVNLDPGTMTFVSGDFSQTANGRLIIPIGGTNATTKEFGQLLLPNLGNVNLGGTLEAVIANGYAPPVGAKFQFLTWFGRNGSFSNLVLPAGIMLSYSNNAAWLIVTGAVPVQIVSPQVVGGQFEFGFNTIAGRGYTVQYRNDLITNTWTFLTNFTGSGSFWQVLPQSMTAPRRFYRVTEP